MIKDRITIAKIISEMLDNPSECGVYQTTHVYDLLEALVHVARIEAIGWATVDACCELDAGRDPRQMIFSDMLERALKDLSC